MAESHHVFEITSPAGNGPINSTLVRTDFPPGTVVRIRVEFPRGSANLVGVQIQYAGAQLIPRGENVWLKGNHKTYTFDLEDPHPGGVGWFVQHYNSDPFYDHAFNVEVWTDPIAALADESPPVIWLRGTAGAGAVANGTGTPTPTPAPGGGVLVE